MFLFLSFFLGCPEPIDANQGNIDGKAAKDLADQTSGGGSMPTNVDGTVDNKLAAAPPAMGTFPGDLPQNELIPKFSQDDLKDGGVIHGYVKCEDCAGKILIRVLPPPPEGGGGGSKDDMQLITQKVQSAAGAFSVLVPDNSTVVLQVVDDANADGKPNQGERMGMRGSGPLLVEGSVSGIELTVGVFPQREPESGVTPPPDPVPGSNPDVEDGEPPADDGGVPPDGQPMDGQTPGQPPMDGQPGGQPMDGQPGGQPPGGQPMDGGPGVTPPTQPQQDPNGPPGDDG